MIRRRSNDIAGGRPRFRRAALHAALFAATAAPAAALAFELPLGNEDLYARWDNTFRYNLGYRLQAQDPAMLKAVNNDDGDRNFSNHHFVTSRFDDLSEFDIVWKRTLGLRVSAALWYDPAYNTLDNHSTATANTLVNGVPVAGQLSPYTGRYAEGASGEWLDAFGFVNTDVAGIPLNVKAGQHTVYWGDSLLLGGLVHGIAYAQNSVDVWKGFATPGSEAKELFRPRGGVTVQMQPTNELSVAGQWFYNWQAVRYPESGSYLTLNDGLNFGGDSLIIGANPLAAATGGPPFLRVWNTQQIQPSRYSSSIGDWGVSARWSPAWLDGTLGFYYRNATDILPQIMLTQGFAGLPAATCTAIGGVVVAPGACIINPKATSATDLATKGKAGTYQMAYGNNIHIYGLSLAKSVEGVSIGAEISYRQNMPLVSSPVPVLPAALVPSTPGAVALSALPQNGDTAGALGNTWHGLINAVGVVPKTALFDTASYTVELAGMYLSSVTQNEAVYLGRASYLNGDGSAPVDKPTKSFLGIGVNFTPTWFQVLPGVDLLAPISWTQGLFGTAAVQAGGNRDAGNYALGVAADIYQKYRIDLKYTGYYGQYQTTSMTAAPPTGGVTAFGGLNSILSDRGWISLTFKTTF
jgi:hypothetical protein